MNPTSRRAFLGAAAAAFAARAAVDYPIKLGFSFYGMKEFRLGDAFEAIGRIGYESVELTIQEGWPTEPSKLDPGDRNLIRYFLQDLDIELSGLMERILLTADDDQHAANLERIRRAAELAHGLSPTKPPILETVLGGKPDQWPEIREQMAERLADWRRVAREVDITIAIKPHVGGAAHLPEHALWLLRQSGGSRIKAAYDFSHYQLRGLDMEGTLRDLGPETVFVHVKDATGDAQKPQFLLPGQGTTDYPALLRRLSALMYTGAVMVEVSGQIHNRLDYDAVGSALDSFEFLEQAFLDAGLRQHEAELP